MIVLLRRFAFYALVMATTTAGTAVYGATKDSLFERILRASLRRCQDQLAPHSQAQNELFSEFPISPEQLNQALAQVDAKYLEQTLFVLPKNDGEALRAVQILLALGVPNLHVSEQSWGASIDHEVIPYNILRRVQRVVIFEMPGAQGEAALRKSGKEIVIIDHHGSELFPDRYKKISSLEQLAALLNWPLSDDDRAIAVNDRGYIKGLRGLDISEEQIRRIRTFDLQAQGRTKADIEDATIKARNLLAFLPVERGVTLYNGERVDTVILQQELALSVPSGVVNFLGVTGSVRFSGQADIVKALSEIRLTDFGVNAADFDMYHGGDAEAGSMFFGLKFKAGKGGTFPQALLQKVQDTVISLARPRTHQALKPGSELKFETHGDPNNPALVLIHGLDSARVTFANVVDELAEKYFVITYDQRGHGESEARGIDYSTAVMAQDLLGLLDHLKIERAHLLGHSMGARVAVRFAELFPERVDHVAIEDMSMRVRSVPNPKDNEKRALEYAERSQAFSDLTFPTELEALRALKRFYGDSAQSLLQRRSRTLPDGRVQLLFRPQISLLFGIQANREDLRGALTQVAAVTPVLVMGSESAGLVDQAEREWLQQDPRIKLKMFDVGHSIHREDADGFLQSLKEFLGEE